MCVTRTPGAVSVLASRREPSARGVFRAPGTMILTEAASSVGATGRAQWEVSVTNRPGSVGVWKGLELVCRVSGRCLEGVSKVSGWCLEVMSEWYGMCLEEKH